MEGAIGKDGDSEEVGINWARINWREGKEKRKNVSGEEDKKDERNGNHRDALKRGGRRVRLWVIDLGNMENGM